MSAVGASVSRAVGGLGGPGTTAALVAGGIAVGALGGGFLANGGFGGPAGGSGQLAVYPCPDQGPVLTFIAAGQEVLATGRSEDGSWLRIHYPAPGRSEGWVQASPLTVEGTASDLPVAECVAELAIAPPSVGPGQSMTAVLNVPPSAAPTAGPTAAPTAGPTATAGPTSNPRPGVASLTASTARISYDTARYCPNAQHDVTFRVRATDAAGVAAVTLSWREPGAGGFAQAPMNRVSGTPRDGFWQATLDTAANGIDRAGNLAFFATARDVGGATRRIPANGSNVIQVRICENEGPDITAVNSSSGANLSWNPLGAPGNCQTATNLTAAVRDVDGVRSVQLFYRKPGAGWQSKPMNDTTIQGKWYANLDTLGDKISIVSPPNDTLTWYIRAVDAKGLATKSPNRTITIRRCDTEATFFVNSLASQGNNYCPPNRPNVQIPWSFSISDPDQIVRATLRYTVDPQSGPTITRSTSTSPSEQRFNMQSIPLDGETYNGNNAVTWTITTRDRYGGTSSQTSKGVFQIWVC